MQIQTSTQLQAQLEVRRGVANGAVTTIVTVNGAATVDTKKADQGGASNTGKTYLGTRRVYVSCTCVE